MSDLPVSAETSETAGSPPTVTSLDVLLDAPRVTSATPAYESAAESARTTAMAHREQTAREQGNAVGQ